MPDQTPDSEGEGDGTDEAVSPGSPDADRGAPGETAEASGNSTDDEGETDPDTESDWLNGPWYGSSVGISVILIDVLLTIVFVGATTVELGGTAVDMGLAPGLVPWHIYAFSILGALGFVFTALIDDFGRSTFEVIHYNFRLPAALPLGVGIYLFSGILLGDAAENGPLVFGLVFLSGMYVNIAYRQLGALARRLLPGGENVEEGRGGAGQDDGQKLGESERGGGRNGNDSDSKRDAGGAGGDSGHDTEAEGGDSTTGGERGGDGKRGAGRRADGAKNRQDSDGAS